MEKYILAIDQGTTSSRALIFNKAGQVVSSAQREFKQYFPKNGWVEHDPNEIWSSQAAVMAEALTKQNLSATQIASLGITNQRETVVVWNRETGKPIYNAIVWQDRRTSAYCEELKLKNSAELIQQKTGLLPDAYFSATKVRWILNHIPNAKILAKQGKLALGTIDSWLIWNLTNGQNHCIDVTNASRTLLFNIHTLTWDAELLELFDIPESMLPRVVDSAGFIAETSAFRIGAKIPICGVAGDQQAALFGNLCFEEGMIKNTYGTGCFLLMNTGREPKLSRHKLLTTVGWKIGDELVYALEGSIFAGGAIVQWLRDELKFFREASSVEHYAKRVEHSAGVVLVPAFAGLGSPHWVQEARGTLFGLSRGSSKAHICRAALEAIALQTHEVIQAMKEDTQLPLKELRVDGGATANNLLMQIQANVLQSIVVKPHMIETTAKGAAYLAGLGSGFWPDKSHFKSFEQNEMVFTPQQTTQEMESLLKEWKRAVAAVKAWAQA